MVEYTDEQLELIRNYDKTTLLDELKSLVEEVADKEVAKSRFVSALCIYAASDDNFMDWLLEQHWVFADFKKTRTWIRYLNRRRIYRDENTLSLSRQIGALHRSKGVQEKREKDVNNTLRDYEGLDRYYAVAGILKSAEEEESYMRRRETEYCDDYVRKDKKENL